MQPLLWEKILLTVHFLPFFQQEFPKISIFANDFKIGRAWARNPPNDRK